jgi:hypothetical protein
MNRAVLRRLAVWTNEVTSRLGVNVLPVSYYSEVPDRHWLRHNRALWARRILPVGQHWDLSDQVEWLRSTCSPYLQEVTGPAKYPTVEGFATSYGPIEAQVLHGVVRSYAPPRIVEIGSGVSTAIMDRASRRNEEESGRRSEITCIDPYPSPGLRQLSVETIAVPAQAVRADLFAEMTTGDLLFIDSSHAVHTGSEIVPLYLEIIPRLPAGVLIHIHDIYMPYMFSPNLFHMVIDPQETVIVTALLTCNDRLNILASLSAIFHDCPDQLQDVLPDFRPRRMVNGLYASRRGHYPESLWLETAGNLPGSSTYACSRERR